MAEVLPVVYLARYDTAWSLSGQHTGRTDLPLTESDERSAPAVGARLRGLAFAKTFTNPLRRAARTCELAGFGSTAELHPDLVEWDYGRYEGRSTAEIREERPDWQLFHDGCPGGGSPRDRRAGRRCRQPCARRPWRRPLVFERAFPAYARRALARP